MLPGPLLASNAVAEGPQPQQPLAEKVVLEYVPGKGTESCPSVRALRHAILSRMKVDPFSSLARAKLEVRIVAEGGWFQASYKIFDSDGKLVFPRVLTKQEDCGLAVADLAFSVGRFLPLFITAPVPRAPVPVEGARPLAAEVELPRRFRWRLDLGVLGSFGVTDGLVAPGFSAHAAARWPSFSLFAGGRYELNTNNGHDTRVGVSRVLVEGGPCIHQSGFLVRGLFACVLAQIGALSATAQRGRHVTTGTWPSISGGVRFGGEWIAFSPLPPNISLHLYADFAGALTRPTFLVVEGDGDPWLPSSIFSATIGGSVAYLF